MITGAIFTIEVAVHDGPGASYGVVSVELDPGCVDADLIGANHCNYSTA